MATGEVIATLGEHMPFAVLVTSRGAIVGRLAVSTREAGELILGRVLATMASIERGPA